MCGLNVKLLKLEALAGRPLISSCVSLPFRCVGHTVHASKVDHVTHASKYKTLIGDISWRPPLILSPLWFIITILIMCHQAGYTTMYAGKYLNQVLETWGRFWRLTMVILIWTIMMLIAQYGRRAGGDLSHVPNGWNFWAGLVGNSK